MPFISVAQDVYGPPGPDLGPAPLPRPLAIPEQLDRAAAAASISHPLVNAAKAESRALEAEYRGSKWLRYPNLTVEGLATTGGSSFSNSDGITANIALEQPIWTGGRTSAQIESTRANMAAGNDRTKQAAQNIVLDVTQAYYDYALAGERILVLTDSLERHEVLLASIKRRVDNEVSPRTDLILGQSRTAQVQLDLASAEEARESVRLRLFELTGGIVVEPTLQPASFAEALPPEEIALSEALECSPTLSALRNLVDAAQARRDAAKSQLFPQLLIQLSQNEITGARAAFVLRAQTGNGLSAFTAIESADARIQRARAEFNGAERDLREQLRRDYVAVRAARQRVEFGSEAAYATGEIIESYKRQFIVGRRSWLDVMNAVREASIAGLNERAAHVAGASGSARILALTCRWTPENAS